MRHVASLLQSCCPAMHQAAATAGRDVQVSLDTLLMLKPAPAAAINMYMPLSVALQDAVLYGLLPQATACNLKCLNLRLAS